LGLSALVLTACSNGGRGAGNTAGDVATEFVHVHGLAVDKSGVLWVATHRGLIRQNGSSWVYASKDRNDYMGFTVDPTTGTLYRSGHPESGGTLGAESSTDGSTWRHLADVLSPPADFHAMTLNYATPGVLFGWDSGGRGFFSSRNGGTTWGRLSSSGLTDPGIIALAAPKQAGVVFAGTATGLFRSSDDGSTWALMQSLKEPVIALACDPADPKHLLAFTQTGMVVSRDGGSSWQAASQGISNGSYIGAIAISPVDPSIAYAAAATTLYETKDGGQHWTVLRAGK